MSEVQRHQDMKKKIQSKLEALAHPEIWCDEDWLVAVELKMTVRLLHSTNNKEKQLQVGVSTTTKTE